MASNYNFFNSHIGYTKLYNEEERFCNFMFPWDTLIYRCEICLDFKWYGSITGMDISSGISIACSNEHNAYSIVWDRSDLYGTMTYLWILNK